MSYTRYTKLQKWVSNDNGISWIATEEYKKGDKIGEFESLLECDGGGQDPNLQRGYRWINLPIESDWECFNGSKYYRQQRQYTTDKGQTWHDMDEYRMGMLYEINAGDCQHEEPQPPTPIDPIYEWMTYNINEKHECVGFDAYYVEYEVVSNDNGITWSVTGQERRGALYESNSELCGYLPPIEPTTKKYNFMYTSDNFLVNRRFVYNDTSYTKDPIYKYTTNELVSIETDKLYSLENFCYNMNGITDITFIDEWDCSDLNGIGMFVCYTDTIKSVNGLSNFRNTYNIKYMGSMFSNCPALESVDLSLWDVRNAIYLNAMFSNDVSLNTVNITGCNTESAKTTANMFQNCTSLTNVIGIEDLDTQNVTDMSFMFTDCEKLENLNIKSWNVQNVETMRYLLSKCKSITSIDLSGWSTQNLTSTFCMFNECEKLRTVDLSGWSTQNLNTIDNMFNYCTSLETVDFSGWSVDNIKSMNYLFLGCDSLKTIMCPQAFKDMCLNNDSTYVKNKDINWVITD